MSDAIGTALYDWMVPRTEVKKIVVSAFSDNMASIRTFEKNGFKMVSMVPKHSVEARGKTMELETLVWKSPEI